MENQVLSVSDFVAYLNQTLEYTYPSVVVQGEVTDFRISKNRWVYFTIKDEASAVKCFGTVYQISTPIENGMMLQVRASPRLHQLYGFSLNVSQMQPVGQGSIKKAFDVLLEKLTAEGLFDEGRKQPLPYMPERIGLISSTEAAGYQDFIKIVQARWPGINVVVANVQVQGIDAPGQIVRAIDYMSTQDVDAVVLVRGGGSIDDLVAFNDENLVRAITRSRHPVLTGIGHERDVSLADLAADVRASTPSNAAEIIVPEQAEIRSIVANQKQRLGANLRTFVMQINRDVAYKRQLITNRLHAVYSHQYERLQQQKLLLRQMDPARALKRGYGLLRSEQGQVIGANQKVLKGQKITIQRKSDILKAEIYDVKPLKP